MLGVGSLGLADEGAYVVKLEVFNGPMDLLLHLIERNELDITLVSLAAVTDQFIAHLDALASPDLDCLADFLVVASRLLSIKAAMLFASRDNRANVDEEEAGKDLVQALEEYRRFQRAATMLKAWEEQGRFCFSRSVPAPTIVAQGVPEGLTLDLLLSAVRARLAAAVQAPPPQAPPPRSVTIGDKIGLVEAALLVAPAITFDDLLSPVCTKVEIIVTFLALLELIKARRVAIHQGAIFGVIVISRRQAQETSVSEPADQEAMLVGA